MAVNEPVNEEVAVDTLSAAGDSLLEKVIQQIARDSVEEVEPDTVPSAQPADSVSINDTMEMAVDSVAEPDSIQAEIHELNTDSIAATIARRRNRRNLSRRQINTEPGGDRIRRVKEDLDNTVDFTATDSMKLIGRTRAIMYGPSKVTYGSIGLDANSIDMDLSSSTVYAVGVPDSTGEVTGAPVFTDNGTSYESKTMDYNFKTGKGFITDIITEQGEGYLTGGTTKKVDENTFYIENGRYTTCDDHDDPHFWIQVTKAKMRPKKDVVSGPAYMVLAGLPLPIAVPFGYFPFTDKYSSGIIVPSFGDDYNRGFYLSNGGYYFAINDNIDVALTGELYTKGSWGIQARSNYVKRYKFNGNFNISFLKSIYGDKGAPDYSAQTNFQIVWSHTQDAKVNPNLTFSSSVNFATSGYSRNDLSSYYNSSFTENTKSSTVNMTYRFPGTKWSLSTTANISQRTQDSTLTVSFPNVTITMSQLAPFKRKRAVGAERWYEKIKISYTGIFNNSLTAQQNQFFKKSLVKDWRNGMKHTLPVSATFNMFKYINMTPSVTVTDRMYTSKVRRQWDPNASAEICDTTYNFYNVWDFNASLSFDTKVYGFYKPLPFLGDRVKMIRHVLTPTVALSGAPDFGSSFFGYYGHYDYTDPNGNQITRQYSYFPNALFGVPGSGRQGNVSVTLANNLEMKVRSDNDSIGEKKISLIENFSLSQSYNFAADSMNWSNLNTSIMLRLVKNFNLNLSATWDVYTYQLNEAGNPVRVNIPRWKVGKGWGRLSSTGTSFSYTFSQDTFKKKKDKKKQTEDQQFAAATSDYQSRDASQLGDGDDASAGGGLVMNRDGYMKWEVPWSLTFNYSVNYGYGEFDKKKMEYKGRITQNLSCSGNIRPTQNWSFSFTASYNFDTHKLAYMNCNLSRDLHCFTMSASFVPVGPYKSFNFHIAVKSSLLSDLKYDKRSSVQNGIIWY